MSDDKVRRVSIEYSWVSDRIIATDDEHGGTHYLVTAEVWELSKSHFIETDKLLAEYQKNEQLLMAALREISKMVPCFDAKGTSPRRVSEIVQRVLRVAR
jgi:hypothetical protein